jgi:hypothetical protein
MMRINTCASTAISIAGKQKVSKLLSELINKFIVWLGHRS